MASGLQRLVVLLLLFFLCTTAVPITRTLKKVKNQDFHFQDVKEVNNNDVLQNSEGFMERRMNVELADYPEIGANPKHNPYSPTRP